MRKVVICLLFLITFNLSAQNHKILSQNVNQPSYSSVYPVISGDGKVMLFMSNYSDDGKFTMMQSKFRSGRWSIAESIAGLSSSSVDNWGGYTQNYDGTEIFFSSRRSEGIGLFDIWYSQKSGNGWSRPKNIGKPLNSPGNEGNPSITVDKQRMYFMRCETMSVSKAKGCKLFYSQKGPRGWREAIELPDYINIGNTTSPRIMPDGKTLFFASDRPGGKGGMDIWMSKRSGDHWSEPINVDIVNSVDDDLFFSSSVRLLGYFTKTNDKGRKVIAEVRLPEKFRLDNVIIKQGIIKDEAGDPLAGEVRIYNMDEQAYEGRVKTSREDGAFLIVLPEGARYDVSYNESKVNKLYNTELVDATSLISSRREYPNIILLDLVDGLKFPLKIFSFKPYSSEIEEYSSMEISRLAKLLKQNPELNIEIGVYQKAYIEEHTRTSEDLTEVRTDSIYFFEQGIRVDTLTNERKDMLLVSINQQLATTLDDTLKAYNYLARMGAIDSVEVMHLTNTYHNDRTTAQASAVQRSLIENGIEESRMIFTGYKDQEPPFEFPSDKERLIIIKLISGS